MRNFSVILCLVMLAGCNGTGDASKIDTSYTKQEYENVRKSNQVVTGLDQSVSNQIDAIIYVYNALGLELNTTTVAVNAGTGGERVGHSNVQSDRTPEYIRGKQYQFAVAEFQNMYNIRTMSNDEFEAVTNDALMRAYLVAGGTGDYTWDTITPEQRQEVWTFIKSNATDVLGRFFVLNGVTNEYNWTPRVQTLGNVQLNMPNADTTNDRLIFILNDKGKITGIEKIPHTGDGQSFERLADTNRFSWSQTDGENNTITGYATLQTYGAKNGLKYADFGVFSVSQKNVAEDGTVSLQDVENRVLAGGFSEKQIQRANITGEYNFTGQAVGNAINANGDKITLNADANMNFNNGVETLGLEFSSNNWYDVEIVRNGSAQTIQFTANPNVAENMQVATVGSATDINGVLNINYYGDGNVPNEFVGTVIHTDAGTNGVQMNVGFGGAK